MSLPATIDLEDLGFDRGAHILLQRSLRSLPAGARLRVCGHDSLLAAHLAAWCRQQGHGFLPQPAENGTVVAEVVRGDAEDARWGGAERAGSPGPDGTVERADPRWGLAARGALVEAGGPESGFDLDEKAGVWTDLAPRMYGQAAAAQWNPATAIDWQASVMPPPEVEAAVVQVMTYLVENEQAALAVPARFLGRIHPHFREAVQFLALQVADEARHVEVFTRRAGLHGMTPGLSTAGGRASLTTLLAEPDFSLATFLLSVLGEGTFLNLLAFLERYAPDSVTAEVTRLARQDETRHVAFAMAHLEYQVEREPALRDRLRGAIERRYEALRSTSGLNDLVRDALVVLAAGSWEPSAVRRGYEAVLALEAEMAEGRERRLSRLGFAPREAAELSALHTRNYM